MDNATAAFQIEERRCKICMSPERERIDAMLLGDTLFEDGRRYQYADIVAAAAGAGLQISKPGLSRHYSNHVQPSLRAMLQTQQTMEAVAKATGKRLSLHTVFANIVTQKVLRLLEDIDRDRLSEVPIEKLLRIGLMAGRNGLHLEKAERLLTAETVKSVEEKLTRAGLEPETLKQIKEELYGLTG
jgi:glutathione S-transferase